MIWPQFSGVGISGYKKVCTIEAQVLGHPSFLEPERIFSSTDLFLTDIRGPKLKIFL
jgi:hypothetical protein